MTANCIDNIFVNAVLIIFYSTLTQFYNSTKNELERNGLDHEKGLSSLKVYQKN